MVLPQKGALRDLLVLAAVFGGLLGVLYLFTGVWPPAVIVESGSMMHADDEVTYGRFGTIDPGDLVLVKRADDVADVETYVEGGRDRYGASGDVIVYFPANNRARVPIIHRAMFYVEVVGDEPALYKVRWGDGDCPEGATRDAQSCVWGGEGITLDLPRLSLSGYRPKASGFVTKGDNPATNPQPDQISGLSRNASGQPVPVDFAWVEGKARGELPWLGLIKLALAPRYNQEDCGTYPVSFHFFDPSPAYKCRGWVAFGHAYAPKDLWVMLGVSLFALVGVPLIYDSTRAFQQTGRTLGRTADGLYREPVVLTVALSVVTLGLWAPIWFLRQREGLNALAPRHAYTPLVPALAATYWCITIFAGAVTWATGDPSTLVRFGIANLTLLGSLVLLPMSLKTRNLLEEHFAARGEPRQVSLAWAALLHVYYLQLLVNEIPAPRNEPAPPPSA